MVWAGTGIFVIPNKPLVSCTIHYLQIILVYVIWWWQFSRSNGLTPLFIARLGWSVKMRSMHDDEFWRMCVGSDISWENPYIELIDSICVPSFLVISWTHQLLGLALKSPGRIVKVGSWILILPKTFSRDKRKCPNST